MNVYKLDKSGQSSRFFLLSHPLLKRCSIFHIWVVFFHKLRPIFWSIFNQITGSSFNEIFVPWSTLGTIGGHGFRNNIWKLDIMYRCHFNFGDTVYGPCLPKLGSDRIQKVQTNCLRFVYRIRKFDREQTTIALPNIVSKNNEHLNPTLYVS